MIHLLRDLDILFFVRGEEESREESSGVHIRREDRRG